MYELYVDDSAQNRPDSKPVAAGVYELYVDDSSQIDQIANQWRLERTASILHRVQSDFFQTEKISTSSTQ